MGRRARRDENNVAVQRQLFISWGMHGYGIRPLERGKSVDEIHFVRRKILSQLLALSLDHHVLAVHEILHRQAVFQRVVDAVETALLDARIVKRGFAENLAGNRSGVNARATQNRTALYECDALAEISGLSGSLFARGTGADYNEVILFHSTFSSAWRAQSGMLTTREAARLPDAAG